MVPSTPPLSSLRFPRGLAVGSCCFASTVCLTVLRSIPLSPQRGRPKVSARSVWKLDENTVPRELGNGKHGERSHTHTLRPDVTEAPGLHPESLWTVPDLAAPWLSIQLQVQQQDQRENTHVRGPVCVSRRHSVSVP